jgi:hypothetical protein
VYVRAWRSDLFLNREFDLEAAGMRLGPNEAGIDQLYFVQPLQQAGGAVRRANHGMTTWRDARAVHAATLPTASRPG